MGDDIAESQAGEPVRSRVLEERLLETRGHLADALSKNEKLAEALREARENLAVLREEVKKLSTPPSAYGVLVGRNDDGSVDVLTSGRRMRVTTSVDLDITELPLGSQVVLNEGMNVILSVEPERIGEVVTLKEILSDGTRVVVALRGDDERVLELSDALRGTHLRPGDLLRSDVRSGFVFERLPQHEVDDLLLEEVPNISYSDIGGLDSQIEDIADAVELPFLHQELFTEYQLPAPKGILLYGPPGCGKTLIAKAVANSLAKKVASKNGDEKAQSYFINIKGPELLNKYVGETERQIRMVFQRAREKSEEGWPVIVFFDEMDSMFRTRGTGVSSDMESTIVPQLLAEIDGVEGLKNVIVIGATNREDLIDPAILRPGRLDVKIKIERPDALAARQIFARYLSTDLPIADSLVASHHGDLQAAVKALVAIAVETMYAHVDDNQFLEVTYQGGDKEILYFDDFASGAMIENIVRRAKKTAIKREIATRARGIVPNDLVEAVRQEFREHEDLPNTTNPDDWAKVSGKKGERIVFIRTIVGQQPGGRAIEPTSAGQYL